MSFLSFRTCSSRAAMFEVVEVDRSARLSNGCLQFSYQEQPTSLGTDQRYEVDGSIP